MARDRRRVPTPPPRSLEPSSLGHAKRLGDALLDQLVATDGASVVGGEEREQVAALTRRQQTLVHEAAGLLDAHPPGEIHAHLGRYNIPTDLQPRRLT